MLPRNPCEHRVGDEADGQRVDDGAEPQPLTHRNPQQEDEQSEPDHDKTEADAQASGNALVKDIPWTHPELRPQGQRNAAPEKAQPERQPRQAATQFGDLQWREAAKIRRSVGAHGGAVSPNSE